MTDHVIELAKDAFVDLESAFYFRHGFPSDDQLLDWYRETFYDDADPEPAGSIF